jgi:hypothetical protein
VDSATAPVTAPAMKECHRKLAKNCRQEGHPRDCRQGGPLWRGQHDGSGQREKPSRGSLQQTLEEEMQTWCQQTPLQTFQLNLACLQSPQTHLLSVYLKLTSLQCQQTPRRMCQQLQKTYQHPWRAFQARQKKLQPQQPMQMTWQASLMACYANQRGSSHSGHL